ncbi:hypothetical protein WJX81_007630 [Elliptochloris bilobata]|uniref:PUM-HD domain-containing protein n=1 Tax=Elliptochloris bilobata TaxID=381761 RepID=A0AAW1RK37_9CHLO
MKRKAEPGAVKAGKATKLLTNDSPNKAKESSNAVPDVKRSRKEVKSSKLAKRKKNYSLVQDAIAKWEVARRRDVGTEQRAELVTQLLQQVQGHLAELAASHTGSRIVQACVKFGSSEQRRGMLKELSPAFLELAKSPYGHFVASKLVSTASAAELAGLLRLVQGQVPHLLRHPCAAAVVDELYDRSSGAQRNALAAEFFGKEYVLFAQDKAPDSLAAVLQEADAKKQHAVIQRLAIHLLPIMEKGLLDPVLSHRLIAEYLQAAPRSAVAEAVETLAGPALLRMVHTRHGALVACQVLAFGTAKDRKKAVKAMKGHVHTMMEDEWAHVSLLSALTHVDDTALLAKTLLPAIMEHMAEAAVHRYARRVLLQLLAPDCSRYLPPHLHAFLHPSQPAPAQSNGGEVAALGVSKKGQDVRRAELLGSGPKSLAAALASACNDRAGAWLRSPTACDVVVEVARGGSGGLLYSADAEGVAALHTAIVADLVGVAPSPSAGEPDEAGGEEGMGGEAARVFTSLLWRDALQGRCEGLLGTHAKKVLAAVAHCADAPVRQEAAAELGGLISQPLSQWAAALLGKKR